MQDIVNVFITGLHLAELLRCFNVWGGSMKREYTLYEIYLASVYKWGMFVLICACICADVVYTTMKIAGLYPTVSLTALIMFDAMDIIFAIISFFLVRASIKNGLVDEKRLKEGKIFAFFALLIQWNFILYMIPSRTFWGLISFFIILISFFLDLQMILLFGGTLILSLFTAWMIKGNSLLPYRDELFVADQIVCTIALFLILIGIVIFVYFMTHMQWLRKQDEKHLKAQSKYYQELTEKDEGVRRFQHDVKKHIYALDALCKEGNLESVQSYISELIQEVQKFAGIQTGNQIADCFFYTVVQELEKTGGVDYEIVGRFPREMNVNNVDFCVLFANAMENAKEALEKLEDGGKLILVIRNYQKKVYITLKNTTKPRDEKNESTNKNSRGYGLQNMKLVTEKYGGTIEWKQTKDLFELNISI